MRPRMKCQYEAGPWSLVPPSRNEKQHQCPNKEDSPSNISAPIIMFFIDRQHRRYIPRKSISRQSIYEFDDSRSIILLGLELWGGCDFIGVGFIRCHHSNTWFGLQYDWYGTKLVTILPGTRFPAPDNEHSRCFVWFSINATLLTDENVWYLNQISPT